MYSSFINYKRLNLPIDSTLEFVSENGALKEILLCMGDLATKNCERKAVLLPTNLTLQNSNAKTKITDIQQYLFEPDSAIIRAGLVQEMGNKIGYKLIDSKLALLTGSHILQSDFGKVFEVEEIIEKMNDEGHPPDYDGNDYGLYQIYGKHILCGPNTLLYIGKATQQTFSKRFKDHKKWWLDDEEEIQVYLGRVYDSKIHSEKDNWKSWERDVGLAENILIYKYSPNYNNTGIGNKPSLSPFEKVKLIHTGKRHRLEKEDHSPEDYS